MTTQEITGQRVEIRFTGIGDNPDNVQLGDVAAFLPSGVVVVTDRGRITLVEYGRLCIDGSDEQRKRIDQATARVAEALHDCGPLCREHGDPRDTSLMNPWPKGEPVPVS